MRIKRSKVVKKNAGKRYEHLEQSVRMMQPGRNGRSEFLQFNDLQRMDDNKMIAVNSNYIYWALVKLSKQKNRQNVLDLKQQINKIDNEKQLYVPMAIKEAKKCFKPICKEIPDNTFKRI